MSPKEKSKLRYLLSAYLAVYETRQAQKERLQQLSIEEAGDEASWYFDWERVVNNCSPEVLVVLSSSDRRDDERIPTYALIPDAGDWIELRSDDPDALADLLETVVSMESSIDQCLSDLYPLLTSLPEERRGEAMKHLNALKRITRVKE